MRARLVDKLLSAITRRRTVVQDSLLLLVTMGTAIWIAFEYQIFPSRPDVAPQERIIDLDEALALVALLCVALLVLLWRLLLSQRREVTRRIEAELRARQLAHQDSLTGLPNRRQFDQELRAAIAAPPRLDGAHAVLLLDLNGFKRVNDVYGHAAGDEILINVAVRLRRTVREGDLVARFGGDEFAILARQLIGAEEATSIAQRVTRGFDQPITLGSVQHQIGVSVGIALVPCDGQNSAEVMRKADIALYRAKASDGSTACFFETAMDAHIRERDLIEVELSAAIRAGAVRPFFQPSIDLRTGRLTGFEALARWRHATLGDVPPDRFIPIAESCGLINQLTDDLLGRAARAASGWPKDLTLSFNISTSQLKDHTLASRILSILGESGMAPGRFQIEIAESGLVRDPENAREVVGALRRAGVRVALDDFGAGYSSLYHVRNLKIDALKIDRSFVSNMEGEPKATAFIRALLGLGHGLGLDITAEGVEQPEQARALLEAGCQQAQGHLYGSAMSADDAAQFIAMRQAGATRSPACVA
jgi:diguanylate cyclase (GGDEF)-like protein